MLSPKKRAPRNRTIDLTEIEYNAFKRNLLRISSHSRIDQISDRTIFGDIFEIVDFLPGNSVDLMIIDPPYNLAKTFNSLKFPQQSLDSYQSWIDAWMSKLIRLLKPTASIYVCSDWKSSLAINRVCNKYFNIRNRITWEREKGRGAKTNWKNCSEDIWYCTVSNDYTFNVDAVKMMRKVIAPYKDSDGEPKDWEKSRTGNFRITHPSNLWTDISIPFWSMPENTDHPTQKPEKLIAKMILASSKEGDMVFDPFLGSGTTSVVARKLRRRFFGVELDEKFCCLTEKRLKKAIKDKGIQGYSDGLFWERNSLVNRVKKEK
ncbi:site-specific DNA-methyltransferase [bacterium]|nr:site-specific DNA-methyltransferase [bacterium]